MTLFITFLITLFKQYKLRLLVISVLMAIVGIAEGLIVALIIPLLQLTLGDTSATAQGGFFSMIIGMVESLLGALNLKPTFGIILIFLVFVFFLQGSARFVQMYLQWDILKKYEFSLVHKIFNLYMGSAWKFFVSHKVGHLVNIITSEAQRATAAFQFALQSLAQVYIILMYIIVSLYVSWKITLIGLVLGFASSIFLKLFMGKMEQFGIDMSKANSEFQATATDLLSLAKMIKASATENQATKRLDKIIQNKANLRYISQLNGSVIPSFYFPLVMGILSIIVFISTSYWNVTISVVLIFVYIFYRLIPALSNLHGGYEQALVYIPALDEIRKIEKQIKKNQEVDGKIQFHRLKSGITFKNVSLSYNKQTNALSNINITIEKGKTTAIVGMSGAGKTSLVDLILRLLQPTSGTIHIDDEPLNHFAIHSYRKRIGYLSQDVFLFHDTIGSNIRWFAPQATQDDIVHATKAAYAYEFISSMPKGLDTIVGDRGVKLSGGQRQRIALSRIILQNPDIIIFDEAMSSLDSSSEEKIKQATKTLFRDKTKIIITHRLASIKEADVIFVLENGNIVEKGNWNSLLSKNNALARMHKKQNI